MNQVKKLEQLNNLSYFDKATLSQIIDIPETNLYSNIKRWLKKGLLIQLKRGLYVTEKYFSALPDKKSFLEFIANKLREPSYLSLEYVLQKHSILTESVFAYTSVTLKTKRLYENNLGRFIYRAISKKLFTGYEIKTIKGFEIKEATKAKALFDYLYLKLYRQKPITQEMLTSLRLNLEEFTTEEKDAFSQYCQMTGLKKFTISPKILFKPNNHDY